MSFSIIIPVYNEEDGIALVLEELINVYPNCEIIVVDDGSTDNTYKILQSIQPIRILKLSRNLGQGVAISKGLEAAQYESCIILDGDGQYKPTDIEIFLDKLKKYDLVYGLRNKRRDDLVKVLVSKIANSIRRIVLNDPIKDTGCGLKAMHRRHRHLLPCFEGTHRYIPTLLFHAGLKLIEVPIDHRPRLHGRTKYTHTRRALRGIIDLLRIRKLIQQRNKNG